MADGLMSAECVTRYASFFSTDIDTAQNWLLRSWNDCGSCWQCCQNRAHLGFTPVRCSLCMTAAERVVYLAHPELRKQLVIIFWLDGHHHAICHLLPVEVYTRWRRQASVRMSTFAWLTLLMRHIKVSCRTRRHMLDQTMAICSALRIWSSCLKLSSAAQTSAKTVPKPLMTAVRQFCRLL